MTPLVSIIIPIYGVEKYIERCVRSCLSQTYQNIEFIFVNDCTQDHSIDILQQVILDYPLRKVILINKEYNEGLPQARKTGYLASHGEYIIHFDSDDWVEPNCIEQMMNIIIKMDVDIVLADYYIDSVDHTEIKQIPRFLNSEEGLNLLLSAKLHSGVWNKLVHRRLYKGIIFPKENMHEDLVINTQIFINANSFAFINKPFYHYNQSNVNSLTQNSTWSRNRILGTYENFKLIENILHTNGILACHVKAFSNMVNSFKSLFMMHKNVRNQKWLYSLLFKSSQYIFLNKDLSFIKRLMLYLAFKGIVFPYKIIDIIRFKK